ncbi:MAG: hypothetical protein COA43_13290 [Robiginitomaculum sp.]|nr:MAG: hypothetical protein COA43_13290 [Robiginitomaculum sp.]
MNRIYIFCILCVSFFFAGNITVYAQDMGDGDLGWCTVQNSGQDNICVQSAHEACRIQMESFAPTSYIRPTEVSVKGLSASCDWPVWPEVNEHIRPASVGKRCKSGYGRIGGVCREENSQDPPISNNSGSCDINTAPNSNPIHLLTGAKVQTVMDFETLDGLMSLKRVYNSMPGTAAIYSKGAGIGAKWRLSTSFEVRAYDGSGINIKTTNGGLIALTRNSEGVYKFNNAGGGGGVAGSQIVAWRGVTVEPEAGEEDIITLKIYDFQGTEYLVSSRKPSRFDTSGLAATLHKITYQNGYVQNYYYKSILDGRSTVLDKITDSYNRTMSFEYLVVGFVNGSEDLGVLPRLYAISAVDFPDGSRVEYSYKSHIAFNQKWGIPDVLEKATYISENGVETTETYHYENPNFQNALTGITDANGVRYANWTYNSRGLAISSEHALGTDHVDVAYSELGRYVDQTRTVTNPLGKEAVYNLNHYASSLRIVSIDGQVSDNCPASNKQFKYNSLFSNPARLRRGLISTIDKEGRETKFERDYLGRVTKKITAVGLPEESTTLTSWHAQYNAPTQIVVSGLTTDYDYDGAGRLLGITQTDTSGVGSGTPRNWAFSYTADGLNVASIDGPLAGAPDTQSFTYDGPNLTSVTNALGHMTQITSHSSLGLPTMIVDPNNVSTALAYDHLNRATTISQNIGGDVAITNISYDNVGNVTQIIPPNGASLSFVYDDARRLTSITNAVGETINYTHNVMGAMVSMNITGADQAIAYQLSQTLDELNRVITSVAAAPLAGTGAGASSTTRFGYDKEDNLTSTTDPRGGQWSQAFDGLNRVISSSNAIGATTTLKRSAANDNRNDLTEVEDARGATTNYLLNGFGEVIRETNFETGITNYVRDARGLVTQMTDARGIVTNYTYDAASRPLTLTYPDASENISYVWDSAAYGIGQIASVTEGYGVTEYSYNALGHMLSTTRTINGQTYTTQYSYDLAGEMLTTTHPSGRVVKYVRDAAARITSIETQDPNETSFTTLMNTISYTAFGPMTGGVYGDGHSLAIDYDQAYRATNLSRIHTNGTSLMDIGFEYNQTGDITALVDKVRTDRSQEFAYDDISRLIFSHGGYGDFSFSYNLVGDRTVRERTYDDNGTSIVDTHLYDYDPTTMRLSEVTSEQTNTALRTFSYAATGQVISDERTDALYTYGLNQNGRINTVSMAGASVATYTYDDDEQRIVKAITGQSPIHYIYDQDGRLIAEHDGDTGAVLREYMWLGMMPVATYVSTSGTGECDEDAITALEQNIADITALITTRTTKAENLRTKITVVNTRITTKRDKIATHKAKIVELKAKIANTNNTTRIANLRAKIATKRARIDNLRTQIDTLKTKRKAHNKKLRKHERRIGILGQERTALTTELEALQSQCEGGEATAGLYFLHADHLGKTQFATDTTGAIIWDGGITTPFGESLTLASAFTQNLMFPGQYADSETGLSHNWHRTYDPMLGRYLQSDPIGLAGGLNRYAYVGGNPVSYVDPTGEFGILGAVFGGGLNLFTQLALNGGRLECVDWADVAVSAVVGAFIPGSLSSIKTARVAFRKRKQISGFLKKAKKAKSIQKFKRRRAKADRILATEIGIRVGAEGIKHGLKKSLNYQKEKCGC